MRKSWASLAVMAVLEDSAIATWGQHFLTRENSNILPTPYKNPRVLPPDTILSRVIGRIFVPIYFERSFVYTKSLQTRRRLLSS